jgi:hypothetical protein
MTKIKSLQNLVKNNPYLVWYTKNYDNLSEKSVVESVLNYGDWKDYLFLEKVLGVKELNKLFRSLKNQKRNNLRPQTLNYFTNYFAKYA